MKRTIKLMLASVLLAAMMVPVLATTWYVSPDGKKKNEGTSPDKPIKAIWSAVEAAQPGDTILVAEGKKESQILEAEAKKQATILAAEAQKEKEIREAEGRAEAIRAVQSANAEGIRMIKEAGADDAVLTIKSLEALEKAANGNATKIIIPSEIQGLAGLATSFKEIVKDDTVKK